MKKIAQIFTVLLTTGFGLFAQNVEKEPIPLNIGLYGPYVIQPGIKVGPAFGLKKWSLERGSRTKPASLFVSPQIGVFVRPKNHISYVINGDLGYKMKSGKSNFYMAASAGLGYLMTDQLLSTTIDLGSGDVVGKDRELRNYFLPTINFELGKEAQKKIGWFTKFSYSRKISSKVEDSAFFAVELGLKTMIKRNGK